MEKIILVDGNNLMFRSYYATAYTGNLMKNKDGFPTNGLYGFTMMMNKIIKEENPKYIMVAFDIGKTFRHEEYKDYKAGRTQTPEELKMQFPVAKKILTAMGITYLEIEGYEADDIIGTYAKEVDKDNDYIATIVSSDKDLLQLISPDVTVKLLKSKDYIMMDEKMFGDTYGIEPIRMIDLKALMGDPSDNIPGVKGIGEKTALKLLTNYDNLDNIYANINNITGSIQSKLISGKEDAYFSYKLATINKDVPLEIDFSKLKYNGEYSDELIDIYRDLGFYSFLKKIDNLSPKKEMLPITIVNDLDDICLDEDSAIYIELDGNNYHTAEIKYIGIYNDKINYIIEKENINDNLNKLSNYIKYTYDNKSLYVSLSKIGIKLDNITFDTMIASYLLNYNSCNDISDLASDLGYDIPSYDKKSVNPEKERELVAYKTMSIYEGYQMLDKQLKEEEVDELYYKIEFPLSKVLAKMEITGIKVETSLINEMKDKINNRIEGMAEEIYKEAGMEFNIMSPRQLGEVLFEKLNLPYGKKNKVGYVTDSSVLNKLKDYRIANLVIEYRYLNKLYSTYLEGILNVIRDDGKVHTIYTQTATRTGRLSSLEPNLQNIPVRDEFSREIRKCFVPDTGNILMSSDYSQIELRMFAHLSNTKELIEAFNNDEDIHRMVASEIFGVSDEEVTSLMRRKAKAVNFGIIYGISSYGLSEDLDIPINEAKDFLNKYLEKFTGIKDYMGQIKQDARVKGYVKTIMNRKRNIDELKSSNFNVRAMGERMALNTPVQGSSADILKKAMVKIDDEFTKRKLKSKMILQVHDELIFDVNPLEEEVVYNIIKDIMENIYKLSVPLKVNISKGNNWYEAK